MSEMIQTTPKPMLPSVPLEEPPAAVRPGPAHVAWRFVKALASLRLTVFLFVLSLILVFFGTLAQIDGGIWNVVERYFRSLFVWIPYQLAVQFGQIFFGLDKRLVVNGAFPFPGGWLIGTVLLANLIAAHLVRFRISWKRSGILLIHGGLILMMGGELVTGLMAVESRMTIDEGKSSNYTEQTRFVEFAVVNPVDGETDHVVVVPQAILARGGEISDERLPFDIEVVKYMGNSFLVDIAKAPGNNLANRGAGLANVAVEEGEVAGTAAQQKVETPSAYLRFKNKDDGKEIGTYLFSIFLNPQPVAVGDKTYQTAVRFKRDYKPYALHLIKFRFDRYEGTETPKNFSSLVKLQDTDGSQREVLIRMNEPLRHAGETFYQADFDKRTEATTVLQVVRNPGWLLPYFSCAFVSLGMMVHFGLHLVGFLRKRVVA